MLHVKLPSYRVYIAFTSAEDTEAVAAGGLKAMSHIGEKPRNLSLCKLYIESGTAAKYTNPNSYLHNSVFKSIFFLLLKKKKSKKPMNLFFPHYFLGFQAAAKLFVLEELSLNKLREKIT